MVPDKIISLTLFFIFFLFSAGYTNPPENSGDRLTAVLAKGENLSIPVNGNIHKYIILKCTNMDEGPSVFITSSSIKGKRLNDSVQGPESFRRAVLEKKTDSTAKTFICEGKDTLNINAEKGLMTVTVVKVR